MPHNKVKLPKPVKVGEMCSCIFNQTQWNKRRNKRNKVAIRLPWKLDNDGKNCKKALTFLLSLELDQFLMAAKSRRNIQLKLMRKECAGKVQMLLHLALYNMV